ncbi:MAG TPA: hypothetical protein VMT53_12175 [Terriglobales bacterium]|nr:hypothetical protein [Terriglobales bacterium]
MARSPGERPSHCSMRIRTRRRLTILIGVLAVIAAVAVIVELRRHAPPEPARLLPTADAFAYINLQWIRRFGAIKQLPPVSHDPDYQTFIQQTGIEFERDLNRAAFAVHYPTTWGGITQAAKSDEPRFSEVFEGNIHRDKLVPYLQSAAKSVDNYRSSDIFNIPLEGRTLRVAMLGVDTLAVSNSDDPGVIRGMIDRSRKLASPFAGPALLRHYYKEVPLVSLAWGIVRVTGSDTRFPLSNGIWSLLFQKPSTVVLSARYLTALHLRAEAITDTEDTAKHMADQATTILNIFRGAEISSGSSGSDNDVKEFFDSLKVQQHDSRAVLTAVLSPGFIRKIVAEAPPELVPPPEPPTPAPPPPSKPKKRRGKPKGPKDIAPAPQ